MKKLIIASALAALAAPAFACSTCPSSAFVNATVTTVANGRVAATGAGFVEVQGQTVAANGMTSFRLQSTHFSASQWGGVSGQSTANFNELRFSCNYNCGGVDVVQVQGNAYSSAWAYDPVTITTNAVEINGIHAASGGVSQFHLGGNAQGWGTYNASSGVNANYQSVFGGGYGGYFMP
jgi:hypothetical protein